MISSRTRDFTRLIVALLLTMAPATASAQVVWDNGTPNAVSVGMAVSDPYKVANDFKLGGTTQLLSFDWYAQFTGTNGPNPLTASFYWEILNDLSGKPGSVLRAGSVVNAIGTQTQFNCCYPLPFEIQGYRFSTAMNNVTLGAGTYWLAISAFSSDYAANYYWAQSTDMTGNQAKTWTGTDWKTHTREGAFVLYGTPGNDVNIAPEPGTLALLATGFAGLGKLVRRRKKTAA